MMWLELLPLALLGGILGLDVVGFPQAMISRPLVASTLRRR
jgi:PTS system mannose-specific IIC component